MKTLKLTNKHLNNCLNVYKVDRLCSFKTTQTPPSSVSVSRKNCLFDKKGVIH